MPGVLEEVVVILSAFGTVARGVRFNASSQHHPVIERSAIQTERHQQGAAQAPVATAVVVATQSLHLEAGSGIDGDGSSVVGPDLERDLVGSGGLAVLAHDVEQGASPSLASRLIVEAGAADDHRT